jgi:hypothetical protein
MMRRPWIGREDFINFYGTRKTSSRKVFEKLGEEEFLEVFFLIFLDEGRKRMKSLGRWWKGGEWVGCLGYFEE